MPSLQRTREATYGMDSTFNSHTNNESSAHFVSISCMVSLSLATVLETWTENKLKNTKHV
jgi:hypothetical protein